MTRRTLWLTGLFVFVLGAGVFGVQQCRWNPPPLTAFTYGSHERPRVFVSHHPLIPRPGAQLTVRLSPDLPAGVSVTTARATLMQSNGTAIGTQTCTATAGVFDCRFDLPNLDAVLAYSGSLDLSNGEGISSRTSYQFTVASSLPDNAVVQVRVPIARTSELESSYRVDTAFARDPQGYSLETFVTDVETGVFEGVLRDPAYRWRDDQLGFFVFTRPAFVTSYFSGRDTRCGKNPWPRDAAFPQPLDDIEAVGILHRKASNANGIEGRVTAPVGANVFRDCAGQAVKQPAVGTFSASAGLAEFALIATHEFGHAAFGLGDEYTESDATRNVPLASPFPPGECCCVADSEDDGGGVIVTPPRTGVTVSPRGLLATMRCVSADGTIRDAPLSGSPPACGSNNSGIADACFSQPDGGCPPLAGDCVKSMHWLDSVAAAATPRPNVFTTEAECLGAAAAATAHPGVEEPTRSLGTCRQLCGGATGACPCGVSESWIVDRDPGTTTAAAADVMGAAATGALHGGTCIWCVETSLCVRWQRALGDSADAAWRACEAPPKQATQLERWSRAITAAIAEALAGVLRVVRF